MSRTTLKPHWLAKFFLDFFFLGFRLFLSSWRWLSLLWKISGSFWRCGCSMCDCKHVNKQNMSLKDENLSVFLCLSLWLRMQMFWISFHRFRPSMFLGLANRTQPPPQRQNRFSCDSNFGSQAVSAILKG